MNLFKSSPSSYKKVEYINEGGNAYAKFHFNMKVGAIAILVQRAKENWIILTCYDPRKISNLIYGEKDFVDDISKIVEIIDESNKGEDAFFYAYDRFCKLHIKQYSRLIDTDCFRIIAEFIELMGSIAKLGNETFEISDKVDTFRIFVNRAVNKYSNSFYVTKYRINGLNIEPYLVKYSDIC